MRDQFVKITQSTYISLSLSGAFSGLSKVYIKAVSRLFSLPLSLSILSLLPSTDGCSNTLSCFLDIITCHVTFVMLRSKVHMIQPPGG